MYTWFCHEIHDRRLGLNGKNVETIDLSLSEIFQVYLVDNCISRLQLLASNTAYLFGFRRAVKITYYMRKICRGEPQNLANWPTEFPKICRGKLWSLVIYISRDVKHDIEDLTAATTHQPRFKININNSACLIPNRIDRWTHPLAAVACRRVFRDQQFTVHKTELC